MPPKNWRSKKQPVASSYKYELQGKSQSPTLGEEPSPLTGDRVLVSNMHTPSGTTPEENMLRLTGAFHVESENNPRNLASIARHSSHLGDETSILESRTLALLELTSESEGENPTKGKGKNNVGKLTMSPSTAHKAELVQVPDPTQVGNTSPRVMMTENSPLGVRILLTDNMTVRLRTDWARQTAQQNPQVQSTQLGASAQPSPPPPKVRRISEDHSSVPISGIPRGSPRSLGSNSQTQDDRETSATHALIAVCQWLDEMTRQCEEQQERILKLMNSLSISIDDKLGTALDQMTDALDTTRAILSELQRPQRYSQLGEDTHTQEKGKKDPNK